MKDRLFAIALLVFMIVSTLPMMVLNGFIVLCHIINDIFGDIDDSVHR